MNGRANANRGACRVESCDRPSRQLGLCAAHYHRLRRYGDPEGGKYPVGGVKHDHGTRGRYRQGCRCQPCKTANSDAARARARAKGVLPRHRAVAARKASAIRCAATMCRATVPAEGDLCAACARRAERTGDPDVSVFDADPQRRILRRIRHEDECWIWTGAVGNNGYGRMGAFGRLYQTHRFSYEAFVGPIPEGLHIDHLCRNRLCVNPDHLEPVTQAENNRRANAIRWAK